MKHDEQFARTLQGPVSQPNRVAGGGVQSNRVVAQQQNRGASSASVQAGEFVSIW